MNRSLILCIILCCAQARGADTSTTEPWDRVPPFAQSLLHARTELGDDWSARFGGQARAMYEAYRHPDFGFTGVDEDSWIHERVQTFIAFDHAEDFTLGTELTWGDIQGKNKPLSPPDRDDPDFLQLYAQARFDLGDSTLQIRAGRQELYYGSGRLLAVRNGANQRLTHDALRIGWRGGDWRVDGIIASPVKIRPGAFDNTSYFNRTLLWGVYATGPGLTGKGSGTDLYYLGLRQENAPLSPGQTEHRHTFGTRLFGHVNDWEYNNEFILQTGSAGSRDILAGAVSLGGGRKFSTLPFKPTLAMKADLISGGQSATDVHTFNPLFLANNYFNEGGFVSPSNLWNLNPIVKFELHRDIELELGVNFLWRYDAGDSVYASPFKAIAGAAPHHESYLGTAYNLALSWELHPSCEVSLGLTHHEAGASITSLGGKSVDYLQLLVRVEF